MSVESMAKALQVPGLDPVDKLLLVGIANHDGDGGAWPSLATLAVYLGKSVRSVQRHLANLERVGLISRHIGAGGNSRTRNDRRPTLYTLHLDGVTTSDTPSERGDINVSPRSPHGVTDLASRGDKALSPEPSLEPSIEEEPSKEERALVVVDHFETFWQAYPRKADRIGARAEWDKAIKRESVETILLGASRVIKGWADSGIEKRFIPHARKWLRYGRWDDEIESRPAPQGRDANNREFLDRLQRLADSDREQDALERGGK